MVLVVVVALKIGYIRAVVLEKMLVVVVVVGVVIEIVGVITDVTDFMLSLLTSPSPTRLRVPRVLSFMLAGFAIVVVVVDIIAVAVAVVSVVVVAVVVFIFFFLLLVVFFTVTFSSLTRTPSGVQVE